MAKSLFICFLLANAFLGLAIEEPETMVHVISTSPSSSPSHFRAEAPVIRKLGKHHQHSLIPTEAPQSSTERSIPNQERSPMEPENEQAPGSYHGEVSLSKQHHHSFDKSIAGGGVILVGLATTFLVAVFCYIRTTARHKPEAKENSTDSTF